MRKLSLAVVALALTVPGQAQAADKFFDNYCIMGSFQVCASVRLSTSGNTLTMQVWNLEGTYGTPHTITAVGIYGLGGAWSSFTYDDARYYSTATTSTSIKSKWSAQKANDIKTHQSINLQVQEGTSGNAGINGCTLLPPNNSNNPKWQTCNSFAAAPYVEFKFTFNAAVVLDNAQIRWHSTQVGPDRELSLKCDTNPGAWDSGSYQPCVVVPEPFTIALLGSGLAGLGGVGLLRRRRKGLDA